MLSYRLGTVERGVPVGKGNSRIDSSKRLFCYAEKFNFSFID